MTIDPSKKTSFAEVIESSLSSFLAQSWQWDLFPTFGSLVSIQHENQTILGIVTNIKTGSMDPMRYPFPYQKTENELLAEQPQIFEFLKTTFTVTIVGFVENGTISHVLPGKPCKIHAFISKTDDKLVSQFFSTPEFLHLLFSNGHQDPPLDELLLAILKELKKNQSYSKKLLENFCETFSLLSGNDYRRLKLFLQRVERI